MKNVGMRFVCVALVALGCGGAKKEPETSSSGNSPVPPSSASAAPASTSRPDMTAASAGAQSDEVTKGIKALEVNDFGAAQAYFNAALKKNGRDADALYYLGLTAERNGDKAAAEKSYKEALKIKPDLEQASVNLSAMYDDAGRYDEAILVSRAALGRHGDDAALHLNLAVALAAKADAPGSSKEFDEALKISPNEPVYHMTYGHWLGVFKQVDAALTQLRAARPLAGDNVGVLAGIGHELHLIHAFTDCVPTFDKAIAIKDAAELRTERAACEHGAQDDVAAMSDLMQAVHNEPNYPLAHYYLGLQLGGGGKWKEAIAEFETYLKLAPTGPLAKAANEKIKAAKAKAAGQGH